MSSPRKPNSSYFGPRRRMSTRLKESEGRFRSKPLMKMDKECRQQWAYMKCMNPSKSNHMYDVQVNVVTDGANTISPNDSKIEPSSAFVAKNSKSGYVLASKCASQPTTSRLENSRNPSSDSKGSKPSIVRNALPSKIPKASSASWKSKDDSNAIPRHLDQSHHIKTSRASPWRTKFKAMPNLIHKAKNVGKEGTRTSKHLESREVSRKSNIPVVNRMDPNKDEPNKAMGSPGEVVTKEEGMKDHAHEGRVTCGNHHTQTNSTKADVAPKKHMQGLGSLRDNSSNLFGKNHSGHQRDGQFIEANSGAIFSSQHVPSCEYTETNVKLPNGVRSVGGIGKTNDVISRRKRPLLEEKASTHVQKDLTCRSMKRRRYIEANEDDEGNNDDLHPAHIKDVTTELTPQVSISKHCVEQQCYCCSKPIEIPRWSGIFKINGKKYISLAGHLSSKSCEKVWELSSLPKVVQVTKVPRMAMWPKIFKGSKPTGDNIGLYLFPPEMRHDEELDQLINEVMDKDLILRAVIDEAEMLIFPSVLLPERYQTFQRKPYLWAAFKTKEDKGDVIVEQEGERENHISYQLDDVQSQEPDQETILTSAMVLENQQFPANSTQEVKGCCVQGPTNMCLEHESPEERRFRDSLHRAVCTTATSTGVANAATVPTEVTSFTTDNASFPKPPAQSSSVFGIVIRQAPNREPEVQQFIQKMEQKGALVTVMRGEAIGGDPWPSNVAATMQSL